MTKYIIKPGLRGMFKVDPTTNDIDIIDYCRTDIDWMYCVPEDGVVTIKEDETEREIPVKAGNMVVQFYSKPYLSHKFVVLDSQEWSENIAARKKYDEEERKRWELEKACESCDAPTSEKL